MEGFPQSHTASASLGHEVFDLFSDMHIGPDDRMLYSALQFERSLLRYSLEPEVTDVGQRREIMTELNTGLAIYHEGLPLSAAERRWVSELCGEVDDRLRYEMVRTTGPAIEALRSSTAQIMSEGRYFNANGEELYQRWCAWRRRDKETGERIGFDVAVQGLRRVHALLRPDASLPIS